MGQIEGAFVMGMGLYLHEEIRYDPDTGRNLTNNAWVSAIADITHSDLPSVQSADVDTSVYRIMSYPEPEIFQYSSMWLRLKTFQMSSSLCAIKVNSYRLCQWLMPWLTSVCA